MQDLRWEYIRAGKAKDYHGPAVHPRHLSLWEKSVLGIHKQYNMELHNKQQQLIEDSLRAAKGDGPINGKVGKAVQQLDTSSDEI